MNTNKFIKILAIFSVGLVCFFSVFLLVYRNDGKQVRSNDIFDTKKVAEEEKEIVKKERNFRMLAWGDMMLDRHVGELIAKEENSVDYLFEKVPVDFWGNYDLVMANLEGTVTNDGEHYAPIMAYDFAFHPDIVGDLGKYNFKIFNLANNHFWDQGERGIIETRDNLAKLGFDYFGCEDRKIGDCSTRYLDLDDFKIGLAGFSMVYGIVDKEAMIGEVEALASSTDMVIANIHWGVEYEHYANDIQKDYAHALVDAGADIVIGHHPHVVQGIEIYNNKPIFYSLGNFIFDQYFSQDTQEGLALDILIKEDEYSLELLPFRSQKSQVFFMEDNEKEEFLKKLADWSEIAEEDLLNIFKKEFKIN